MRKIKMTKRGICPEEGLCVLVLEGYPLSQGRSCTVTCKKDEARK
jgi:hypothetical protein